MRSSESSLLDLPAPAAEAAAVSDELCRILADEIAAHGPIPFSRYMELALYHPRLGYYRHGGQTFGAGGDFVTAPELGGLFATGLARHLAAAPARCGPDWTLLELGAGTGALARDLLTRLETPPARYLILETSAALRRIQSETLSGLPDTLRDRVAWLDTPPADGSLTGVILANEVIDALPADVFGIEDGNIVEYRVAIDNDRFTWRTGPPRERLLSAVDDLLGHLPHALPPGYRSEIRPDLPAWLETVSRPLARGWLCFIDYGYDRASYYHPERRGGTLACHYRHRAHFEPFWNPGLCDLTAWVDFTALGEAAEALGLEVAGYASQAEFLLALDILDALPGPDDPGHLALAAELKQLVLPGEMGEKFRVMALGRDAMSGLPGL